MESSIAVFFMRQLACEQLPTCRSSHARCVGRSLRSSLSLSQHFLLSFILSLSLSLLLILSLSLPLFLSLSLSLSLLCVRHVPMRAKTNRRQPQLARPTGKDIKSR